MSHINICHNNGECIQYCNHSHISHKSGENFNYGYCPSGHCNLIKCKNYKYCNMKRPQLELNFNCGYCNFCSIYLNHFILLDITEKCIYCSKIDNLAILDCGHKTCYNCIVNMSKCQYCKNIYPFCINNNRTCYYNKYKCNICRFDF